MNNMGDESVWVRLCGCGGVFEMEEILQSVVSKGVIEWV